jgi:butyryl-CoA dehydrogenase
MAELVFEEAHVPAENLILPPGRMKDLFTLMASDRIAGNPPIALGIAQAAFTAAVQHVKDRTQFGKPLIENQGLQWKLADMATDIETARALIYNAAVRTDLNGSVPIYETSMAKIVANEMVVRVTNQAIQLGGSFGLSNEYPFERYFRDARGLSIGYGTTEIHRNSIARDIVSGAYSC